jgi:aconitate hydratase 2/2-methylisocitrate dehydratase
MAPRLGRIPALAEYQDAMGIVNKDGAAICKHLNFDQIEEYVDNAKTVA